MDENEGHSKCLDAGAVLKELKIFFMSEEHVSDEPSPELESYNQALDLHKAILVYAKKKQVHQLYLNDELLELSAAIKAITKMIEFVSGDSSPVSDSARGNQGHANISTQSARDSTIVAGGSMLEALLA